MRQFFLIWTLFVVGFQSFASSPESVMAVVDAGSTGSRIHLYVVTQDDNKLSPSVKEIFKQKISVPLASFAEHPDQAGASFNALLIAAQASLDSQGFGQKAVPLYIYSTAGMRALSQEKIDAINLSVKQYIDVNYPLFKQGGVEVRTISGEEEAFFAWTSVNDAIYSLGLDPSQTAGIVEMGGASVQVAFAVNYTGPDVKSLQVHGQDYHVLTKSFLGLGQSVAISSVSDRAACTPKYAPISGTDLLGDYSYGACDKSALMYFNDHHVQTEVGVLPSDMTFYGLSAFYYSFSFFGASYDEQGLDHFKSQAQLVCGQDWDKIQQDYKQEKPAFLKEYCFAGAYSYALLNETLGFSSANNSPKLRVVSDKVNNRVVEWSEGFVVLQYLPAFTINH